MLNVSGSASHDFQHFVSFFFIHFVCAHYVLCITSADRTKVSFQWSITYSRGQKRQLIHLKWIVLAQKCLWVWWCQMKSLTFCPPGHQNSKINPWIHCFSRKGTLRFKQSNTNVLLLDFSVMSVATSSMPLWRTDSDVRLFIIGGKNTD